MAGRKPEEQIARGLKSARNGNKCHLYGTLKPCPFKSLVDNMLVHWYISTMKEQIELIVVERVQTGVRMEKRLLKVLKGLAELKDMTLGDLLEGIVLHAFEGKAPFSGETLKEIEKLRSIYGLTLKAADSHQLKERRK